MQTWSYSDKNYKEDLINVEEAYRVLQHLKETHGFFQELKILPYNKLSK
jgi:hypothetical protein